MTMLLRTYLYLDLTHRFIPTRLAEMHVIKYIRTYKRDMYACTQRRMGWSAVDMHIFMYECT